MAERNSKNKHEVSCSVCGKKEIVGNQRFKTYLTCSKSCLGQHYKNKKPKNQKCTNCGVFFHMKESQVKRYNRSMGIFCSMKCSTNYKKEYYKGNKNPNYRGAQYDSDGYRINHYPRIGRVKEHRYVAEKTINRKIPDKYVVHHRDCNIYNNDPSNLVVLTESDHRWLHKQFGNATLYAFMNKKIDLESLVEWSNDKERAGFLLDLSVEDQRENMIIGFSDYKKLINYGQQMIKSKTIPKINFIESETLSETDRGDGGFGSTGN